MSTYTRIFILPFLTLLFFASENMYSQCNLLCNTDFENNQITVTVGIVDQNFVPCWKTSASDSMIEVWHTGYNGVPAYSGSQFIELNAYMVSTLYQNFIVSPGTNVTISFAHRGRAGTDVMSLEIGPVGGPYTSLGTFSDGNTSWGYYNTNYTIPTGQGSYFTLRFNSISAAGGNPAIGNFLDAISVNLSSNSILNFSSTPVSCYGGNDGTASVSITNGSPPYSFTWTPTGSNTASTSGLSAGIYSLSAQESNGCIKSGTIQIMQGPPFTATVSSQDETCLGASNGSAQIAVSGTLTPFSYTWSSNSINTSSSISGLISGTYSVSAINSAGCQVTKTFTIQNGPPLTATIITQDETCIGNDGLAEIQINNGNAPYTYSWSAGTSNTSINSSLPSGNYWVSATSSEGCSISKTFSISQTNSISLNILTQNESCLGASDGSATVSTTNTTIPVTYTWMPMGITNVTSISSLPPGTYTVIAKTNGGCQGSSSFSITAGIPLQVTINSQATSCYGAKNGSVEILINSGVAPYTYTWSPGGSSSNTLNMLSSGIYTVSYTSNNGCVGISTITVSEGMPLNVSLTYTNITCNGKNDATIQPIASGGTTPYTYTCLPTNNIGTLFSNLGQGTYTIIATSSEGCIGSSTQTISDPSLLSASMSFSNVSCPNYTNAIASIYVSGGSVPYNFQWSSNPSITTNTIGSLTPGTYTCIIQDANSCILTQTFSLSNPPSFSISVNSATICPNDYVMLIASGAQSYTWQPGNINSSFANLSPDITTNYTITASNSSGCTQTTTTTINVYSSPYVNAGHDTTINMDEPLILTGVATDFYGWLPMTSEPSLNCNFCHEITVNPQHNTCYILMAYNFHQCVNRDTLCVTVTHDWAIYVPNAFTPVRADNINDVFIPVGYGLKSIELFIFDRWGELIFKSDEDHKGWDGKYKGSYCKSDVYVYQINYTTMDNIEGTKTGHVSIIR